MSLICDETGQEMKYGIKLMAGTRDDVYFFSAISQEILKEIPSSQKRKKPCDTNDEGINIHLASSKENIIRGFLGGHPTGNYSKKHFELGKFLYSISRETAEQYLPNHYQRYPSRPIYVYKS